MSKRILVIDDEKGVRDAFTMSLEDTEYQVDTAKTGEIGVERSKNGGYNLIYLDLKMPGITGVETMRQIRKIDKDVHIYIITAFKKEFFDELKSATEDGIEFNLIKKPLDSYQIISVTKSILE